MLAQALLHVANTGDRQDAFLLGSACNKLSPKAVRLYL